MGTPRKRLPRPEPAVWPESGQITLRFGVKVERVALKHCDVRDADPTAFHSVRRIPVYRNKRSVPRLTYLRTLDRHLPVESGLEESLALDLDDDPEVVHVVSQPALFPVKGFGGARGHFVDLMDIRHDGQVTMWFVRAPKYMDAMAIQIFGEMRDIAADVGWRAKVFTGHSDQKTTNLAALRPFNYRPFWADDYEPTLLNVARDTSTIESFLSSFSDERSALTVLWWAINTRLVHVDLESRIGRSTRLSLAPGGTV